MAKSRKKVVIRTLENQLQAGYLPASGLLDAAGSVDLLDLDAHHSLISLQTIRWIAYVGDFNLQDAVDPERLNRKAFLSRPRTKGLWVRLTLLGGDTIEGLAALDLSLADGFREDAGIFLIPPDIRSNTQRLYIPRTAIAAMQLLAVVTTPSKSKPAAKGSESQNHLFT
jgi:hypothetical protein